jgi:hypothetical protein
VLPILHSLFSFVRGSFAHSDYEIIGQIYNWKIDSLPKPVNYEQVKSAIDAGVNSPLLFDGQIRQVPGGWGSKTQPCTTVKITLELNGKELMYLF